jgi:hypothetical protein
LYDSHIYVFDKLAEEIIKTISFKPHSSDHPDHPYIYPFDICFTKTGYGIVFLRADGMSGMEYDIIDSSLGDSIYHPQNWSLDVPETLMLNYDFSQIIIKHGAFMITTIDGTSHEKNSFSPPVNDLIGRIFPNKMRNEIYISGRNNQYILNLENNQIVSTISYIERGGMAEFSYNANEEHFIYNLEDWNGYFRFLDYNNSITLHEIKALRALTGTMACETGCNKSSATTDGRLFVVTGCSHLYIFDTEIFSNK